MQQHNVPSLSQNCFKRAISNTNQASFIRLYVFCLYSKHYVNAEEFEVVAP